LELQVSSLADPREPIYTIGVAAKKLGISPESLRFYEQQGLVIPFRTPSNRRLYSQRDFEWIECFRNQMKKNKLNVAGVRLLLALMPCWDIKPCTAEERLKCPAYMNYEVVCWTLDTPGSEACRRSDCRECRIYLDVCRAGKLDTIYIASKLKDD